MRRVLCSMIALCLAALFGLATPALAESDPGASMAVTATEAPVAMADDHPCAGETGSTSLLCGLTLAIPGEPDDLVMVLVRGPRLMAGEQSPLPSLSFAIRRPPRA